MTLQDLLEHHRKALDAVEAYFRADIPQDPKTRKSYAKHVELQRQRVALIEKIILDDCQPS